MLKSHFIAVEKSLFALKGIGDNAGHTLHKGTPREVFIREFLQGHLSRKVAIGMGEIIDYQSQAGESRNQHDLVIYRNDFPKIDFGGNINAFLSESVVASIEVKTKLTKEELRTAIIAARRVKSLQISPDRSILFDEYVMPKPLNILVAYGGPKKMTTVHNWIETIYKEEKIAYQAMPENARARLGIASPALDAIFVLGKGFVQFDNFILSFINDEMRRKNPNSHWMVVKLEEGVCFIFLPY